MLPAAGQLLAELDVETPITRRVLERLPETHFDWRPHPKSLSVGQLAQHVASIPGAMSRLAQQDGLDVSTRSFEYASCASKAALLATLDESAAAMRALLTSLDEPYAMATWRLSAGDREIFAIPRLAMIRNMAFNHWIHHRGELVVYLRLLDIPVPVVYGRSADENPLAVSA